MFGNRGGVQRQRKGASEAGVNVRSSEPRTGCFGFSLLLLGRCSLCNRRRERSFQRASCRRGCLVRVRLPLCFRACLKNARGSAARDFGPRRGAEAGESPQRALSAESTKAADKRTAAPRGFRAKDPLASLRLSHSPAWGCSFVAPRHRAFCTKTEPLGFLKHTLERRTARAIACPQQRPPINRSFLRCVRVFSLAESVL